MLTSLRLTNFKAWQNIDMRLAPMTALFGTNSSGKSSILQFLLMLKQTADSPDRQQALFLGEERSEKSLVALGSFDNLLNRHATQRRLDIGLSWTMPERLEIKDPDKPKGPALLSGTNVDYSATITRVDSGAPRVEAVGYRFDGHGFQMRLGQQTRKTAGPTYALEPTGEKFKLERIQGRPPKGYSPPIKCYGFPDDVRAAYKNAGVLSDLELAFEHQMQRIYYLGPLREHPYRDYRWSGAEPQDMGRRGEKFVPALLAAAQRGMKVGKGKGARTLEVKVAYWLKELGLIHDFRVTEVKNANGLYEVHVQRSAGSAHVLLPDVGFGVSQVLPVLVLCYYVPEGSTILLEQPEIHLHPAAQRGLADVFIDAIKTRKVQIIVESHSEDLLRRLQRRVAEEQVINEKNTAIYFCDAEAGKAILRPLELDTYGNFLFWPKDFFGDPMSDIAAMNAATMKRKGISEE